MSRAQGSAGNKKSAAPWLADQEDVYRSVVAFGAPLTAWRPRRAMSFETAFAKAARLAHHDATLLKHLPVALFLQTKNLDWTKLRVEARREGTLREVMMLVELTASLAREPELAQYAKTVVPPQDSEPKLFFRAKSRYDEELAKRRSPTAARRWGFLMNMPEESFRTALEKHRTKILPR